MEIVLDIECDNLLDDVTKIHCLCFYNLETKESRAIVDYNHIRNFLKQDGLTIIGHNIIQYDIPVLEKILDIKIKAKFIDTLALSWYLEPLRNRHGLESYGEEFGVEKPKIDDWNNQSVEDYIHRCSEDVKINTILWDKQLNHLIQIYESKELVYRFIRYISFKMDCLKEQEQLGLRIDLDHINLQLETLSKEKDTKVVELAKVMPKVKIWKTKHFPKNLAKKDGTMSKQGENWFEMLKEHDLPLNHIEDIEYSDGEDEPNPGSSAQIKDWLYSLGWIPENIQHKRDKVKNSVKKIPQIASKEGGGEICPSIHKLFDKEPALELLSGLSVLTHRISIFDGFLKNQKNGRLYPGSAGLTNTLRLQHRVIVNLPGVFKKYGKEIRSSIIADEGCVLLGTDMSGIEDRTKQHYLYKYDPDYVNEMRTEGFDPHLDIAIRAGMLTSEQADEHRLYNKSKGKEGKDHSAVRHKAKTTNYAATYGAGAKKIAITAEIPLKEGEILHATYWKRNWAITEVANSCKIKRVKGMMWLFNPISNFWYSLRAEKDKFSTLNQSSSCYSFDIWMTFMRIAELKIPFQYHDEALMNVKIGEEKQTSEIINKAMQLVNDKLKLNIELGCSIQIGKTYADTH